MALHTVSMFAQLWLLASAHVHTLAVDECGSCLAAEAEIDGSTPSSLVFVQLSAQGVTVSSAAAAQERPSDGSAERRKNASGNLSAAAEPSHASVGSHNKAAGRAAHAGAKVSSRGPRAEFPANTSANQDEISPREVATGVAKTSRRAERQAKKLTDPVEIAKFSARAFGFSFSALALLISPLTLMIGYLLWRYYGPSDKQPGLDRSASKTPTATLSIEEAIEQVGIGRTQWILLILCGLTFTSDAAEITFLSFVTEVLRCEWGLTSTQEAAISSAVFVGMLVGCPVWGWYADHAGRRQAFLISSVLITGFGFATALAPNVECLMLVRALVGFGVAGLPVGFDILAEALPAKGRGTFLLYIEFFWTAGSIYVIVCAQLSLERVGWQLLTALSAVPTLVATLFAVVYLPESPRWLVETGKYKEAVDIVNDWARRNQSDVRIKALKEHSEEHGDHGPADAGYFWRTMRLMATVWFAFGVAYYGIVLLIPRLFEAGAGAGAVADACLLAFDYKDIATSSAAEVLGTILALMMIDRAGRCATQAATYGTAALFFSVLAFGGMDVKVLLAAASCVRLCMMTASCATWVHTPELFPTHQRAEAHSLCNLMSKVGAACAPFLVGGAFSTSATAMILAGVTMTAAIAASLLQETAGKEM